MEISVYTDGGARGNPGPAGFGLVVYNPRKEIIHQQSAYLGIKTNNEAEYLGLIAALKWIVANHQQITKISLYSDSELLVRQLNGLYKVKSANLKPLFAKTQDLLSQINLPYRFSHVFRETNLLADKLANIAMDRRQ